MAAPLTDGGANSTRPPAAYGTFASSTESSRSCGLPRDASRSVSVSSLVQQAPPFSRLFFLWFEYIVVISKTRAIRIEDVFTLDEHDRSATMYTAFTTHMTRPRDFVWAAWRLHWRSVWISGLLALVGAVGDVVSAWLLYVVITATMDAQTPVALVVDVLVARHLVKVVALVAKQHAKCMDSLVAKRVLGTLHTLVFDTTLCSSSLEAATVSQASNQFFEVGSVNQLLLHLHAAWLTPLSLAANLVLLFYILGNVLLTSSVVAVVVLLLLALMSYVNKRFAQRVYKHRGRRLQIMSECFKAIQSIKLNAWEPRFLAKIRQLRHKERSLFRAMACVDAMWRSVFMVLPETVLAGALVALAAMPGSGGVNPAAAFASLSILSQTRFLVMQLVMLCNIVPMARVAGTQIFDFLEERGQRPANQVAIGGSPAASQHLHAVRIRNATIGHGVANPQLIMANLTVSVGSLVVIHGNTGAGKSTLLEGMIDGAMLLNSIRASIQVQGRIAYCSQDPWLQTLTIRENILFGLPFEQEKYLNVLHACCLLRDLETLPQGDDTVIGPKGLTLSGGQKARIALARACYADADVYLLDSPLSSVDAIVQGDIFRRCIMDLLKYKTVVLTTHNVEVISSPFVDQVVRVEDHRVLVESGQAKRREGNQSRTSKRCLLTSKRCLLTAKTRSMGRNAVVPKVSASHSLPLQGSSDSTMSRPSLCLVPMQSTPLEQAWQHLEAKRALFEAGKSTECDDQELLTGVLQSASDYVKLGGSVMSFALPLVILCGLASAALVAAHVWISLWDNERRPHNATIFIIFIASCSLLALLASVVTLFRTSKAANKIFDRMVRGVLMAPMSFFYNQPIGEIMTRFTGDIRIIDEDMDYFVLETVFAAIGIVIAALVLVYIVPEMLCLVPALPWMLSRSRAQWTVATQINRFLLASSTPCFDAISEAVTGRQVIQAFGSGQVDRFRHFFHRHLDRLLQMQHAHNVMHSWITLQFLSVESLILFVLLICVVLRRDTLIPLFGLALHYVTSFTTKLVDAQLLAVNVGSPIVRIQRAQEFGAIMPEQSDEEAQHPLVSLPDTWPHAGEIIFDHVSFQYDRLSGPVLHNIHLHIKPGEKIGLVGRTGAGKSALVMALFRIHELVSGRILIDGIDIGLADLYAVRSRLSIIPQSPLFFQGTLRSYLDPFDEADDATLWETLRKTGLASIVTRMEGKLLTQLHENAENLSLGERQLLCLSRVLLKQSRVVVLDEATAAIDHDSDEILQRVLKNEFCHATVVSIAHQLDSILAFDRVVVMEGGCIVQCGTVEELVADATGPFFDLLEGALLKM